MSDVTKFEGFENLLESIDDALGVSRESKEFKENLRMFNVLSISSDLECVVADLFTIGSQQEHFERVTERIIKCASAIWSFSGDYGSQVVRRYTFNCGLSIYAHVDDGGILCLTTTKECIAKMMFIF